MLGAAYISPFVSQAYMKTTFSLKGENWLSKKKKAFCKFAWNMPNLLNMYPEIFVGYAVCDRNLSCHRS